MTLRQRDRDWAHALQQAVEEHFPLPDREWREWPCVPDVEVVFAWLKLLVEEIRGDEREACARLCDGHANDHRSAPDDSPVQYAASEAETLACAIRARART